MHQNDSNQRSMLYMFDQNYGMSPQRQNQTFEKPSWCQYKEFITCLVWRISWTVETWAWIAVGNAWVKMLNARQSEKRNLKFVLPGPLSPWWLQLYQKRLCGWIILTVMVESVPHAPRLTPATASVMALLVQDQPKVMSSSNSNSSSHPTSMTRNKRSRPTEPAPPTNSSTWSQNQNFKFLPWHALKIAIGKLTAIIRCS